MKNLALLVFTCLVLTSCSELLKIGAKAILPSKGLNAEAELVVGDKKQVVETVLTAKKETRTTTTTNTAENLTQNITNISKPEAKTNYLNLIIIVSLSIAFGWIFLPDWWRMKGWMRKPA